MTIGIIILTIGLLVSRIFPEYLTALLFFFLSMLFGIAPPQIIFSGFASGAFWLVFSGLIIGLAINVSGLGARIAAKVSGFLGGSYARLIIGLVFIGLVFSFLMPSAMGRCVLLIPIAIEISNAYGLSKTSKGYTGVALAVILGSFIPAFSILTANVSNMILAGMTESLYGFSPLYAEYLVLHFPILGILKAVLIILLILWLFPDELKPKASGAKKDIKAMSKDEIRLSFMMAVLIALWFTDFVHNISPGCVALAGAVFLLLPKINIVDKKAFDENVNYGALFFVAGVLGLGGVIRYSGLGDFLADTIVKLLPLSPQHPFVNYVSLSISSMLTGILATQPGIPAVLTPIAEDIAQLTQFSLKTVAMTQVFGFSTIVFPYQAPPIIFGVLLAEVRISDALRLCVCLALLSICLLMPLNYLWWRIIGWI